MQTKVKSVATPLAEQEPDSAIKSIHAFQGAQVLCAPGPASLRSPDVDRCLSGGELGGPSGPTSVESFQILPDPSRSWESHADPLLRTSGQVQALHHHATSKQDKPFQKSLKSPNWNDTSVSPEYPTCSKTLS
jgi:hypothetical protein